MAPHTPPIRTAGRCPEDGKVQYLSRADAKKFRRIRLAHEKGVDIWPCGDYFHVGRPSLDVPNGECPTPWRPHGTEEEAEAERIIRVRRGEHALTVYNCQCGGGFALYRDTRQAAS